MATSSKPVTPRRGRAADRRRGLVVRRRRGRHGREQGVAILAVVTAVAIALMIVNEFGSRTTIDMLQARNSLDQTRAHFLARSAVNLGELLLRMQRTLDDIPARYRQMAGIPEDASVVPFSDVLMAAFGGDEEQVKQAIGIVSMDDVKGLGADIGQFGLKLVPVDGKINVNCAGGGVDDRARLAVMLKSLFFPFATNSIFDEEDAEGWRRDYETQVEAIIDYIDTDTNHVDVAERPNRKAGDPLPQAGGEDYGYENLRDRYQPKNNKLDSVGELRLVRGMDDRMWALFGGSFRVHGGCQISLRALDDLAVIQSVISAAAKPEDVVGLQGFQVTYTLAGMVLKARDFGITFPSIADFKKFVADPVGELESMVQMAQAAGATVPDIDFGVPKTFKGIELDETLLRKVVNEKAPRNYQIEAYGDVARNPPLLPLRRTIRGMWDQQTTNQNSRWQGKPSAGAWQWLREE